CPVRAEALKVADRYGLATILVTCGNVRAPWSDRVRVALVEAGPDAADDWIVEAIGPGDICVTEDVLLASRCLKKGASVVRPSGYRLTEANIGEAVARRDLSAHLRETGAIAGGPPTFGKADRSRFSQALDQLVIRLRRGP